MSHKTLRIKWADGGQWLGRTRVCLQVTLIWRGLTFATTAAINHLLPLVMRELGRWFECLPVFLKGSECFWFNRRKPCGRRGWKTQRCLSMTEQHMITFLLRSTRRQWKLAHGLIELSQYRTTPLSLKPNLLLQLQMGLCIISITINVFLPINCMHWSSMYTSVRLVWLCFIDCTLTGELLAKVVHFYFFLLLTGDVKPAITDVLPLASSWKRNYDNSIELSSSHYAIWVQKQCKQREWKFWANEVGLVSCAWL